MKTRWLSCVLGTLALLAGLTVQAQQEEIANIRLAHFAPFAADEAATSVTITLTPQGSTDVALTVENVLYEDFTAYAPVPAGTYTVTVTPTGASDPALSGDVVLAGRTDYTAAAIGNGSTQPFALLLLEDNNRAPEEGFIRLRAAHVAPFAADINDTAVDIRDERQVVLDDFLYEQVSDFGRTRPGTIDLDVTNPDGSSVLIDPAPFDVEAGYIATLFVIGDGENQPLRVFALPSDPAATPSGVLPETPVPTDTCFTGSWFNPDTNGQGLNFEVLPSESRLVGYWYTFSEDGAERVWYTLDGPFIGNGTTATTTLFRSTGGAFNDPNEEVTTEPVGTADVTFTSPDAATVEFDIMDDNVIDEGGTLELQRLTPLAEECTIFESSE
jgi:hypothetical protein